VNTLAMCVLWFFAGYGAATFVLRHLPGWWRD
jgi:hypothetical protein